MSASVMPAGFGQVLGCENGAVIVAQSATVSSSALSPWLVGFSLEQAGSTAQVAATNNTIEQQRMRPPFRLAHGASAVPRAPRAPSRSS
ncbi:MAG TPA: hypothetical protein VF469_17570, partial [Kofleriaceae bacterium]